MKQFYCPTCDNPIKIKEGDYIFSYNIECCNNHVRENVDLEDILSTRKEKSYVCESHNKKKIIHCINCNLDICFVCYKESHKVHKMEYLKSLNYEEISKNSFEIELKEDKKYIDNFIDELMHFKNEFILYIDILKSDLQKFYKFRCDLINNISPDITSYINIENVKNVFDNKNIKIKNITEKFVSSNTFIQRYDNLKNIFELMFKKGKYVENEIINDIYKDYIIPINNNYFIKLKDGNLSIFEKTLELNSRRYKLQTIFEKFLNFEINNIVLKDNKNIKNKLSLYALSYKKDNNNYYNNYNNYYNNYFIKKTILYEIIIENLSDFNIKTIATYDKYINLFVLSENNNILDDSKEISLYDDSFESPKLVSKEIAGIYEFLKIDENTFISSNNSSNGIFLVKIINNTIYKIEIKNCGYEIIYFSQKKKILFTTDLKLIYLINFNSITPEVIQKIEIKFFSNEPNFLFHEPYHNVRNENIIRYLTSFNDESIYLIYDQFLVQYKIIGSELVEISRIKYINKYN